MSRGLFLPIPEANCRENAGRACSEWAVFDIEPSKIYIERQGGVPNAEQFRCQMNS
jgi:hypothetical protein